MSIACDARALVGPLTGVGTWTEQVMGGLARTADQRILLAASRAIDLPAGLELANIDLLPPPRLPIPGTLWLHTWLSWRLAQTDARVWVASLGVVPRRCPVPAVAVVHDLTPLTHPHRHTFTNRFCFNTYIEESLDRASAVVVGSKATEEAVLAHFPWVRPRLRFITYGVDSWFSPAPADDNGAGIRDRFSNRRPYLLHLGTLEPRKGLPTLVAAWEQLQRMLPDPPDLVLAGAAGWDTGPLLQQIDRSPYRERIHRPGYVSRDDARGLLRHAAVFVLPSEAEGFGLPLAESISCGTPSVASDISPLREVAGGAALLAPVGDAEGLARTIVRALEPQTRSRLVQAANRRAPELRWQPVVEAWRELLEELG
jgi:glycosyltransferase involved in cell wall biosynthesis